jgi:enoyl-CoA hydratase/carnithine racemase
VPADRGYEMGLMNQVVEPDEVDPTTVPTSLRGNKEIIRTLRAHAGDLPAIEARRLVELREACFTSGDFIEGIRAFGEKRPPRWTGR